MDKSCQPGITLVPVAAEEAPAISEMAAQIWPAAYGAILPPGQIDHMLDWMYAPDTLRHEMEDEAIVYLWIRREDHRVGFLAYGPAHPGEACPLHKAYLLPEEQGRGTGSVAITLLMARLSGEGVKEVTLRVNRHNAAAIGFYRENDFTLYAEDCREIGAGFVMDDCLMRRTLG